jgi:hypothetical protein
LPVLVDDIRPIGGQAADRDEGAFEVDRRQFVLGRQRDYQVAMNLRVGTPRKNPLLNRA